MKSRNLVRSINKIAWSFIFLLLDIKFNNVSLLPAFAGYWMILSSIDDLAVVVKDILLLKPLAMILTIGYAINWLCSFTGFDFLQNVVFVDLLVKVISVYFIFQLLSDIACLAKEIQPEGAATDRAILRWRNVYVILVTLMSLSGFVSGFRQLQGVITVAAVFLGLGMMVACFGIILSLFEFRRYISNEE